MKANWKLAATAMLAALLSTAAIVRAQTIDLATISEAPEFRITDPFADDDPETASDNDDPEQSASDLPIEADSDFGSKPGSKGCTSCRGRRNWSLPCNRCGCDEVWRLVPENCHGINVGGWINGGVMANFSNNRTSRNDPVPFSNPGGEFLGNQAWGYLEKVADNGGCGWAFGARVDYVFGADGPDTQAFGDGSWDFGWNSGGEYGSAIPQIYGEVAYNDVKVKIGHFYTIMGYEVVQAPGNFFYSHAYTMTYGEPFTHTGALLEYAWSDQTTVYAGYTFGWDAGFDNLGDAHTFLGGFSTQLSDAVNLTYTVNAGRFGNGIGPSGNLGDIFSHSLVVDVALSDRWNYVFQHDFSYNDVNAVGFRGNSQTSEWYGINQYLFYTINECWKLGFRFEWFDDSDGLRIATVNDGLNDLQYWAATVGLNWSPTPNIMVRPELRFDWATSHSDQDFNDIFLNNTSDNLQLFAIDFIFQF